MNKLNSEEFIKRAEKLYGKKAYDYSKIEYVNARQPITIICPKHGEFKKTPDKFLNGQGCPKYSAEIKSKKMSMSTQQFIEKARKIHGDKYDYSKTDLNNRLDGNKVIITCPVHGDFIQEIYSHLNGHGCPKCANNDKLSTDEFIVACRAIYGDLYDYSKVDYKNIETNVTVICKKHGEFKKSPYLLLQGKGCQQCSREKLSAKFSKGKEKFIEDSKAIFGNDKYDYSKVEYVNNRTPIELICPKHGSFWQIPYRHIKSKKGCPKCEAEKKLKIQTNNFIRQAKKIHGDKYDYSKTDLKNRKDGDKVLITCPKHGDFWQNITMHLEGHGCKKCHFEKLHEIFASNKEEFIKKAKEKHGDKYDYSKVEYVNASTPVTIICKEHGEFKQNPNSHLMGCGCPKCKSSHLEKEMSLFLTENNIDFEEQKKFDWLGRQSLDFYIPNKNIAIECQGEQHYKEKDFFGGKEGLLKQKILDERKKKLCQENEVNLLYFANEKYNDDIIIDEKKIIEKINNS